VSTNGQSSEKNHPITDRGQILEPIRKRRSMISNWRCLREQDFHISTKFRNENVAIYFQKTKENTCCLFNDINKLKFFERSCNEQL